MGAVMPRSVWSIRQRRRAAERAFEQHAEHVRRDPSAFSPLRVARTEARLPARVVADAAALSVKTVHAIETGQSPGSRNSRRRLAEALGRSVSELFPEGDTR
jgi:DNA-binding XRE family transcriptional regulator